MNTENLAPVYLDNKPVTLQDAKPKVSAILSAGGKAQATNVKWLQSQSDTQGKSLRLEEVVDRTSEPSTAIYLTSTLSQSGAAFGGNKQSQGGIPGAQQFQPRTPSQTSGRDETAGIRKGDGTSGGEGPATEDSDADAPSTSQGFGGKAKPKVTEDDEDVSDDPTMKEDSDEKTDSDESEGDSETDDEANKDE